MSAQIQETEFQSAAHIPAQRPDLTGLTHYGCSPAFDLNLMDRDVGHKHIKAQALVAFVSLPYFIKDDDDENPQPDLEGYAPAPPGLKAKLKSAWACAEELRYAYAVSNPWGFTVLAALTGLEGHIAHRIFKTVLPRRMTLPEMADHLAEVAPFDIQQAGFPDGITNPYSRQTAEECAESVRGALLQSVRDVMTFCRETLDASAQEMAERRAGGRGKPKADRRDERMAAMMGEPVPTPTTVAAPPPKDELARAIQQQTEVMKSLAQPQEVTGLAALQEQVARLTATIEELQAAKKGK